MKRNTRLFISGFLVGITIWSITVIFFTSHPGKLLELKGIDYLFYLRGSVPPPEDIVIVAIDEASFSELKLSWPWPRKIHAQLVKNLKEAGARIIALDILFADPTNEEDDATLATAIGDAGNVILSSDIDIVEESGYRQIRAIEPMPNLKNASVGIGSCTLIYDPDNVIRRSRLSFGKIKSFAYEILNYGRGNAPAILDINKDILINFIGPARSIKTVSYYQALNYRDYLPEGIFKNKIVLVGKTDKFFVPQGQMSGVEIIANLIDTILRDRQIKGFPRIYINLAMLVIFLLLSVIETRISYVKGLILTLLFTILNGGIAHFWFAYSRIILPVFMPIIGLWFIFSSCSLTKYFFTEQDKRYIKDAFQKYVPPLVVKKILEAPEKLKLGGEEIIGTVLFSDLERFTTVSEKFKPERLVSFINEYLSEMSDIIFKYHGTITRFIGDAILAIWGAPVWQEDHALKSALSAMEMRDKLKELNIEWKFRGLPELKVRIGLNTGDMIVGNVGSKQHFDYTAMGNSVNLASRLEEANKFYGTSIIIGHSTYTQINKDIECRQLDIVRVKGREEPLEIYEPICARTGLAHIREMESFFSLYRKGYECEIDRLWDMAINNFREALTILQNDISTKLHLERCISYKNTPPPSNWDGIHTLIEK